MKKGSTIFLWADEETCEAAAIHEAAHIVVASVLAFSIRSHGNSVDGHAWAQPTFKAPRHSKR